MFLKRPVTAEQEQRVHCFLFIMTRQVVHALDIAVHINKSNSYKHSKITSHINRNIVVHKIVKQVCTLYI